MLYYSLELQFASLLTSWCIITEAYFTGILTVLAVRTAQWRAGIVAVQCAVNGACEDIRYLSCTYPGKPCHIGCSTGACPTLAGHIFSASPLVLSSVAV